MPSETRERDAAVLVKMALVYKHGEKGSFCLEGQVIRTVENVCFQNRPKQRVEH